jgi:Uma2 family endonuclease
VENRQAPRAAGRRSGKIARRSVRWRPAAARPTRGIAQAESAAGRPQAKGGVSDGARRRMPRKGIYFWRVQCSSTMQSLPRAKLTLRVIEGFASGTIRAIASSAIHAIIERRHQMAVSASKYLFTTRDFHRMGDAGVFGPDERVELLGGEVVHMTPIGPTHAWCVTELLRALFTAVRDEAIVRSQNPVVLDDYWEPEPDIAVVRSRPDRYRNAHPTPPDILLLVEVADSSMDKDRETKVPAYARAGVPEVWLIDLGHAHVQVHRAPSAAGYQDVRTLSSRDRLTTPTVPALDLAVSDVVA